MPALKANRPNEKWSMDFVATRLLDGRWFWVLTVVDQFTRECLLLLADSSLTGQKVASALSQVIAARGAPVSITFDNGPEFASKAMDVWAYQYRVQLDFIRPGKPVENSYIESFNGRLRDECLNVEVFFTLADVRDKLERWKSRISSSLTALGDDCVVSERKDSQTAEFWDWTDLDVEPDHADNAAL